MNSDDPPNDNPPPLDQNKSKSDLVETPTESQFINAIREILGELGINEDDPRAKIVLTEVQTLVSYRGPIPPPHMLADYDEIYPGLATRIITAWDEQRAHRQRLESQTVSGSETRMDRSQHNALIVSLVGLLIAGAVGIWGSWVAAAIIALVAVGGPSAATVLARYMPPLRD